MGCKGCGGKMGVEKRVISPEKMEKRLKVIKARRARKLNKIIKAPKELFGTS